MFPVVSQKALKSGTEPGSVASTSSLAPLGSSDSTFLVFRIGSGQARPLVSSVLSGIALISGQSSPAAYINEGKALAMIRRCPTERTRLARQQRAGHHGRQQGRNKHAFGGVMDASVDAPRRSFAFGLERLGLVGLRAPAITFLLILAFSALAGWGLTLLRVDDSLSELFRTDTEEFRRYEEIDRRFPSSEYDVLVVVEGKDLLKKPQLEAFRRAVIDLQLADGVDGPISMLSARAKPDASGYAPPIVPDELPDGPEYDKIIEAMSANDIVKGTFLSPDGELALAVIALDRKVVQARGAKEVIGGIASDLRKELAPVGLKSHLTGAPVMQLEIRNAVERDQLVYNGLGLLFGASIAVIFFKRVSLMLLAALPPVLAVLWSLGLLGWLGFRLNLFLNVMTPLVMVMGFADSMQMVSAMRLRLREGDSKAEAARFAVR